LPWLLAGALAAAIAIGGGGFWAGHHWASSACEAQRFEAANKAALHTAELVAKAQATSDKIWDIGLTLNTDLVITRERTRTITREVIRDVDAHPGLRGCAVPVATQRLRDDQVDASRSASGDPVQR
jgi:hypothetical protein